MEEKKNKNLKFEIYQELGECYTQVGNIDRAIQHFEEAHRMDDSSERPFIGMGIAVLTTPEGVITGKEARRRNVGGEVLCYVW